MNSHPAGLFLSSRFHDVARTGLKLLRCGLFATLCILARQAHAQPLRVVVTVPPVVQQGLGSSDQLQLSRGFERALRHAQGVASSGDVGCDTETCWQGLAERQQADLVAFYCAAPMGATGLCDAHGQRGQLAVTEARGLREVRSFQFGVVVYSVLTRTVTTASAGCEGCEVEEAANRLQGLTESLLRAALRGDAVGSVSLSNMPPESAVYIDGVLRARTAAPSSTFLLRADRPHRIDLRSREHESYRLPDVRVRAGEVQAIEIPELGRREDPEEVARDTDVVESPPASTEPYYYLRSPPKWRWIVPLAAVGVGAILLGVGGRALNINGGCASGQMGCPQIYQTNDVGFGLAGAGGALVGMGVLGLALGVQKVHARVQPHSTNE